MSMIDEFASVNAAFGEVVPYAVEIHVSPADYQQIQKLSTEVTLPFTATLGSLIVHMHPELARHHFVAVMFDGSIEFHGETAKAIAVKILARREVRKVRP